MERMMMGYLAMKTDPATAELINSNINELKIAAKRLLNHATNLSGLGFSTSLLKWQSGTQGALTGVGLSIGYPTGGDGLRAGLVVISAARGSPANKAGILSGMLS